MTVTPDDALAERSAASTSPPIDVDGDRMLARWGGVAGLGGVVAMVATVVVVVALGLPDASDVETLDDFADIEAGRIVEHFLYLAALVGWALHVAVLHRLLRTAHRAAALFGLVVASIGYALLAASSMLHLSTSPLSDLRTGVEPSSADQRAVEYAWTAAQSVFDTMLTTGLLLVPVGIVFFGVAMRRDASFGPRLATGALVLGAVGFLGAAVEAIDPSSDLSALAVLAMAVFHAVTGWRTLERRDPEPAPVDLGPRREPRRT